MAIVPITGGLATMAIDHIIGAPTVMASMATGHIGDIVMVIAHTGDIAGTAGMATAHTGDATTVSDRPASHRGNRHYVTSGWSPPYPLPHAGRGRCIGFARVSIHGLPSTVA